jgi:hypothetical protein
MTLVGKKPRRYRPLASWNSDAPWTTVLSRSKNAAAVGSSRISGSCCGTPSSKSSDVSSSGPAAAKGLSWSTEIADASLSGSGSALGKDSTGSACSAGACSDLLIAPSGLFTPSP